MVLGEVKLASFEELPSWAHDNNFIRRGYRAPGGIIESLRNETVLVERKAGVRNRKDHSRNGVRQEIQSSDAHEHFYEHNTFYKCWKSVWAYAHNETVNIHTHLWGAAFAIIAIGLHVFGALELLPSWIYTFTHHSIFYPKRIVPRDSERSWLFWQTKTPLPLLLNSLFSSPERHMHFPWSSIRSRPNDWKDIAGFSTFLLGAVTVLTCSATFHTVACHSREVARNFNKLDYFGIVAMIVGSFLPMLHYGFYCHPHLQLIYSLSILSLGGFATYTVLSHKYATAAYRPVRTAVFVGLGLSAVFPVAHIVLMYGHAAVSHTMGLDWLVAGGALYVIGAGLYVLRIPERFSPGTFDYFGASHQIFHVLILLAAFSHYVSIRRSYTFWHTVEALEDYNKYTGTNGAVSAVCAAFQKLRDR